eukprot:492186-Alexandrium_andersonii.AAC.1
MSASLVGSEMCIRDRCLLAMHGLRCISYVAPPHQALFRRSKCVTVPVSYTHLTLPTICSV